MSPKKTKKRRKVLRRKSIGVLTSPTKTHSAEMLCSDPNVQEQDFVYMFDKDERKIIGRVTDLQSQWDSDDEIETYGDIEVYGILNKRGKITLKRKPLPPDTKVYKMSSKQVAELLNLTEGMYLGRIALTDTEVKIDPDKFLRGHTIVVGKTGAGKSWGIGCLLEEVSKLDLPAVVIDPHGEYLSLAKAYEEKEAVKTLKKEWGLKPEGFKLKIITANPETKQLGQEYIQVRWPEHNRERQDPEVYYRRYGIVSAKGFGTRGAEEEVIPESDLDKFITLFKKQHDKDPTVDEQGDIKKTERAVDSIDPNLLEPGMEIVKPETTYTIRKAHVDVDLKDIMEPGYVTVIDLHNLDPDESRAAVDWLVMKLFLLRKQRKISPFVLVIEEAHIFCPSEGKEWSSDTIMMIAKEARKFGMPTTFATQRPVLLKTTVRANCENWIVLKITHPSDKSAIIDACEGLDSSSAKTIKNLPVGFAFLTGTIVEFPLVVEIRHRQSQHHYESGFREQLQEYDDVTGVEEGDPVLEENK